MNKNQKIFYVAFMGGLSSIAATGCVWQSRRYFEQKNRWKIINEELNNFDPKSIKNIPWTNENIKRTWTYRLVKLEGKFIDYHFLVQRVQDARMGNFIIRPFVSQNFVIFVNCGWIPENLVNDVPVYDSKTTEVTGLVKLDENKEIKRSDYLHPRNDILFSLIDLEEFEKKIREKVDILKDNDFETSGFIERIIEEENVNSENLYPVLQTQNSFSRPYLTPRRHVEYATFWALTAGIGFGSIFKIIRK